MATRILIGLLAAFGFGLLCSLAIAAGGLGVVVLVWCLACIVASHVGRRRGLL